MSEIDYLFEDPPITNQQLALVSIVGPLMPQKCDVWGLKIRGVAKDENEAKKMSQKILRMDNTCDVYTVEVGKFFPLAVEPSSIGNVVYQNEELNKLIKGYLENKELAEEHWVKRKNDLVKEAIKEGKYQEELANKPEHPIAVLNRINTYKETIKKIKADLEKFQIDLRISEEKYAEYTEEEKEIANKELQSALEENRDAKIPNNEKTIEEIKESLREHEQGSSSSSTNDNKESYISSVIENINRLSLEKTELHNFLKTISPNSPAYSRLSENVKKIDNEINELRCQLENKQGVNDFINSHYSSNPFNL